MSSRYLKKAAWLLSSRCILPILLIGLCLHAEAQVLYGTIVGSVTDQSAAVIPGASVTATQTATNTVLTTTVRNDGTYSLTNIPAGSYSVKIVKDGFQSFLAENVTVTINNVTRVDGKLSIGSVSETVTVSESQVELQTDTADVHHDLHSEQLLSLPTPTRTYQGLLGTLPGAGQLGVAGGGLQAGLGGTNNPTKSLGVEFNGTSNANTDFRIEGVSAVDAWVPWDSTARPSVEAIETVNVVAGTSNVEQGLASGATVNVLLKSGTNKFHGSAYWFHTDTALTAQQYFAAPGQAKAKSIENDFGGTLGGPILRNKLFFFVSYEGELTRTANLYIATVPLPSVLAGNFQQLLAGVNPNPTNGTLCTTTNPATGLAAPCIFDPTTGKPDGTGRTPFFATPGTNSQCTSGVCYNMIPTSRFSKQNAILDALVPAPNYGGPGAQVNNYQGTVPNSYNLNLIDAKVDWNASDKLRFSFRTELDPYNGTSIPLFGPKLGSGQNAGFVLPYQHGLVSAFTGSLTYTKSPTLLIDGGFGFTRTNQVLKPILGDQKYTENVLGIPGSNPGELPYAGGIASQKIGCGVYYDQAYCGGLYTGYGEAYGYLQYLDPVFTYFSNVTKIAGKNTIKFGFNLVNLHMNHVETTPPTISYDGGVTSSADANQPNNPLLGNSTLWNSYADFLIGAPTSWYTQQVNQIGGQKMTELRNWSASFYVGDTIAVSNKLTLAFGTGWEFFPVPTHGNHGMEIFLPGQNGTGTYEVCGFGAVPKDCGIQTSKALFTPRAGFAFRPMNNLVIRGGYSISNDNFNMARNSLYNAPEVIGYTATNGVTNPYFPVGSLSTGIPLPTSPDYSTGIISPLPPGFSISGANLPINYKRGYVQSDNLTIQKTFGQWSAQAGYIGTHSIHMYQTYNMNYCPVGMTGNCQKFFTTFGGQDVEEAAPLGNSHYNGLQVELTRSFANGYNLSANYTYSQWLGLCCNTNFSGSNISDPAYRNLARGIEPGDVTHVLNFTGTVQSPFGAGRTFLKENHIGGAILGGWQLNGVLAVRSGLPFSISDGSVSSGNTQLASYTSASNGHVSYPKRLDQWFDTSAFQAQPKLGTGPFGDVRFDSLRGPGYVNLDLSLFRDISLFEKLKSQIRIESYNIANHPHFGAPNSSISSPAFGSISSVSPSGRLMDQRYLRLGLKLTF